MIFFIDFDYNKGPLDALSLEKKSMPFKFIGVKQLIVVIKLDGAIILTFFYLLVVPFYN